MLQETVAKTVDTVLEVLGTLGVPGTKIAQLAVKGVESLRRDDATRERLCQLVREAEEDFVTAAREAGLGRASGWVGNLPLADLPTFREALQLLGKHWDEAAVEKRLAEEFARIPNLSAKKERRALALYLRCLRARLLADKDLGPIIRGLSILRTEQGVEQALTILKSLLESVNRLLGLPEGLVVWPVEALPEPFEARPYVLKPQYRLIPYTGQAFLDARDELLAWARDLETDARVGLRTYTGRGGAGKTRLLLEVGELLRREGWWVGLLAAGQLTAEHARLLCADARPTLLIVDYIAERSAEVLALLRELARVAAGRAAHPRTAPLALVLLERSFPMWLKDALESAGDSAGVNWHEFVALPGVEAAPWVLPEAEIADRAALYAAVLARFQALLPGEATPPHYGAEDLPEAPLLIALLALHAAAGQRVPDLDEAGILRFTWQREREAWKRHLRAAGAREDWQWRGAVDRVERLSVWATLGRRFEGVKTTATFLEAHTAPIKGLRKGEALDFEELAGALPQLFPQAQGDLIPPIEPDPLADYVLREHLKAEPALLEGALPAAAGLAADPVAAAEAVWRCVEVLARAGWGSQAQEQLPDWLERILAQLRAGGAPLAFWRALEGYLPDPDRTLALRGFVAEVTSAQRDRLPENALKERARLSNNLGIALSALGRREEALAATQEAVDIRRVLAAGNPQAFLPDLAGSLSNLGGDLADLGRCEEALVATQEAAGHYRALAQGVPQAFLQDLAMSLNNLGLRLSEAGQWGEALMVAKESVDAYRSLARADPEASLANLAKGLNNLGKLLSDVGQYEEALQATWEAVKMYRALSEVAPQAFLADLALSLNNLGMMLFHSGRAEPAVQAAKEAVAHYDALGRIVPQTFDDRIAMSLGNLGVWLSALGQHEEALGVTQKAAGHYRTLAQRNPDVFLPKLAACLDNLGLRFLALHRYKEAIDVTQEALAIYRMVTPTNPSVLLPEFAKSLDNLGIELLLMGRHGEALVAMQEATGLFENLVANSDRFLLPDLALGHCNLSVLLSNMGRHEEALVHIEKGLAHYRVLSQNQWEAFAPELARSLYGYGWIFLALRRPAEALAALAEGLHAILPFAQAQPAAFGELAAALIADYLKACEDAGVEADAALVTEIEAAVGEGGPRRQQILEHFDALIDAVVAAAHGIGEARAAVEGDFPRLEESNWRIVEPIQRIWAGERDEATLTVGIDPNSALIVREILQQLTED